jgi:hypothetical protein
MKTTKAFYWVSNCIVSAETHIKPNVVGIATCVLGD